MIPRSTVLTVASPVYTQRHPRETSSVASCFSGVLRLVRCGAPRYMLRAFRDELGNVYCNRVCACWIAETLRQKVAEVVVRANAARRKREAA